MNICITIAHSHEEQGKDNQHLEVLPLKTKKIRSKPQIKEDWGAKQKPKYIKNAWSKVQKKKYINFLRKNSHLYSYTLAQRKRQKINVMMSQAIKSRTAAKCHSYHQKMMLKYQTIQNIIKSHFKQSDKKSSMDSFSSIESDSIIIEDKMEQVYFQGSECCENSYRQPVWMQYIDLNRTDQCDHFIRIQNEEQ